MFEDSLFASDELDQPQRRWTALISFALQSVWVGALLVVPLVFPEALPVRHLANFLQAPALPPPPSVQIISHQVEARTVHSSNTLISPVRIPEHIGMISDPPTDNSVVAFDPNTLGVPGGTGPAPGLLGNLLSAVKPIEVAVTPLITRPPTRVSGGVVAGMILSQARPEYPQTARLARIQGMVFLHAIIAKDGSIQSLRVVSGSPLLLEAAIKAVRQWRYKPYLLNGEPVEVETEITVNFTLG